MNLTPRYRPATTRWLCARNGSALTTALSAMLGTLVLLCASAQAAEEETHLFNATLSLSGDCSESPTVDPVPDPGLCPMPPGVPGVDHPPKAFSRPGGVAVDLYGNRYVASPGSPLTGVGGRIDIFNSSGEFIDEIPVTLPEFEVSLAVDSQGYLYVGRQFADQAQRLLRYKPTKYNPAAGEIEYGEPPVAIPDPLDSGGSERWGQNYLVLAINPANDHLFVTSQLSQGMVDLSSAATGNVHVGNISLPGTIEVARWINSFTLDAVRKRIYAVDLKENPAFGVPAVVKVFDLEAPHDLLFTIDGSTTPTERFVSETRLLPVAVDEATGHVFVGDLDAPTRRIYEFDADGNPVSTIGEGLLKDTGAGVLQLAYDDSPTSPTEGYLFAPSDNGPGRSLAFEPKPTTAAPLLEGLSVSGVTTADAILHGKVNPGGLQSTYRIEYVAEQDFLANGFEGAILAGEGTLKAASEAIAVSAPVAGLEPGTAYRFRVVAENELGEEEADASFATFAAPEVSTGCPNQALRGGPSASLPDCRAYELVTPADTNGRTPLSDGTPATFPNRQVSPGGQKLPFRIEGGPLPGLEGVGALNGDPYLATRTPAGWSTTYEGPSPTEATAISPGSSSPDQDHSLWIAEAAGPAVLGGATAYVRYPDGHSELLGQGSLGINLLPVGRWISEEGTHIVFNTGEPGAAVQLEPEAAPDGTKAIYDRTADGTLHVVSLKPGEVPFGATEDAEYRGASLDGVDIAFRVGNTLYLRHDNEVTFEVAAGVEFAGVAEDGGRVFYVQGDDLEAFDVATEEVIEFSTSGDVTPVNVSADGSAAYFISPSVLTPGVANPNGAEAQPGGQNLYLSEEGQITFVATVTERDAKGEDTGNEHLDGLGLWLNAVSNRRLSRVSARTSADGSVLLFKSRAALGEYDSAGHAQIYRFDSAGNELHCLSCNPTGVAASSDAALHFESESRRQPADLFGVFTWPENLRADGRRAFFESSEGLVGSDTDGHKDVYQWEDQGVGGCIRPEGCLHLISSGQSSHDEHLWAVSKSGDDVFFLSSDLLAGGDPDETPSIYDARVNGGFPPPSGPPGECLGGACQPSAAAPDDPTPTSSSFRGAGNVPPAGRARQRRCAGGKRAVRRAGKRRCVPRKGSKKQAKSNRRAGR